MHSRGGHRRHRGRGGLGDHHQQDDGEECDALHATLELSDVPTLAPFHARVHRRLPLASTRPKLLPHRWRRWRSDSGGGGSEGYSYVA